VVIEAVEPGPRRLDRVVVAEEGLIEQLRDGQLASPREPMVPRGNDGAWLHTHRLHAHPGIDRGCVAEGDVHLLEPGRGGTVRERQFSKRDLGLRVGAGEGREQLRGMNQRRRPDEPDLHRPPGGPRESPSSHRGVVGGGQGHARLCQEGLARGGDRDPTGVALEQLNSELGLQLRERLGQRRLSDVELARGAGYLALIGDGDQVAEVLQPNRHRSPSGSARQPALCGQEQLQEAHVGGSLTARCAARFRTSKPVRYGHSIPNRRKVIGLLRRDGRDWLGMEVPSKDALGAAWRLLEPRGGQDRKTPSRK
jgi:hypothetical protein